MGLQIYINVVKTKFTTTGYIGEGTVDEKSLEVVKSFVFLEALITTDGICNTDLHRTKHGNQRCQTLVRYDAHVTSYRFFFIVPQRLTSWRTSTAF